MFGNGIVEKGNVTKRATSRALENLALTTYFTFASRVSEKRPSLFL